MAKRKDTERKSVGRPAIEYSHELALEICQAVSTSTDSLKVILHKHPHFPKEETIRLWRFKYVQFSGMYADAKRMQAELLAEEIVEISDDATRDYKDDKDGNPIVDFENIQRSRLRVDSRKWLAGKLANKLYGDKQTIEQTITTQEAGVKALE